MAQSSDAHLFQECGTDTDEPPCPFLRHLGQRSPLVRQLLPYSALSSSVTSETIFFASPNSMEVWSAVNSGLSMPA